MFVSVLLTVTDVKAASEPIDGGKEQYGTYIHTTAIKRGGVCRLRGTWIGLGTQCWVKSVSGLIDTTGHCLHKAYEVGS